MIQRKQTIFLFLAMTAMILHFIFPIANFTGSGQYQLEYYLYKVVNHVPDGQSPVDSNFLMFGTALAGLVGLGAFITIFFFKKRLLQAKIVRILILFILAHIGLLFFYSIPVLEKISGNMAQYNYVGIAMPLVAFVFLIFALKGIISDEKLVRSADRLR